MNRKPRPHDASLSLAGREPEPASFSRPTDVSCFGKCSERVDVPVPPALRDLLVTLAVLDGKGLANYVRGVLEIHALLERERVQRIVQTYSTEPNGRNVP